MLARYRLSLTGAESGPVMLAADIFSNSEPYRVPFICASFGLLQVVTNYGGMMHENVLTGISVISKAVAILTLILTFLTIKPFHCTCQVPRKRRLHCGCGVD